MLGLLNCVTCADTSRRKPHSLTPLPICASTLESRLGMQPVVLRIHVHEQIANRRGGQLSFFPGFPHFWPKLPKVDFGGWQAFGRRGTTESVGAQLVARFANGAVPHTDSTGLNESIDRR